VVIKLSLLPLLLLTGAACGDGADSTRTGCGGPVAGARADDDSLAAQSLPALTGRVMDNADLLSASAERELTAQLEALERSTSDELVVLTVSSLGEEPIERLARTLGNWWGIGQQGLDNGVLLIVAPNERRVRIEVGCGLEGLVTNELAARIIDEKLIPLFSAGRFEQGIRSGVDELATHLRSNRQRPQPRPLKEAA
jgi:uncharacterized protein